MLDLRRRILGFSLCGYVRVGGVSRKGEEAYWCFSAPIKPGWFMKCVMALGLYVFSATSSMTPTAASNRMSRSVSLVRNLLR